MLNLLLRIFSLCVAAAGFTLVPGVCLFFLSDSLPGERSVPSLEDRVRETLLLVWVHPFGVRMPMPDCRERFEISGCEITDDQNRYGQADAVLIHHREISSGAAPLPPEPRPPAQNWIWLNLESPSHSSRLWEYEGIYNLTLSYRQDRFPRSRSAYPLGGGTSPSDLPRPRLVAWVVSNWSGARVAFYKLLAQHVQVDVFGRAGEPIPPGGRRVVHLIRRYRFYLALENSQHTDYITEKLWNNYERFLPPEAFIHVDDFPTVQELAQYLLKVKDSPSLIQMHLSWRRDYSVYIPSMWDEHFCTACRAAQKNHGRINVVNNLSKWFYS
uniref:Fucosyltransferase n=1 Tax=Salarias fasciatus TaxID=181472 RepID=A0A672IGF9_SALFA